MFGGRGIATPRPLRIGFRYARNTRIASAISRVCVSSAKWPVSKNCTTALGLSRLRRWRTPESLLQPIGEAMAKFVCDEDFSDVKACEGHNCTMLFVDHTRRRARRWCTMAICGNRAKQAAHRSRQ
ncbi:putative RNA-binding Zn ribbon-like protein [Bradyrhizobium sp. USDA 4486]